MYELLCDAARLGNSNLIQQLAKHFENSTFDLEGISFGHLLNVSGSVADWGVQTSPLHSAIGAGYYHTVEALLHIGADPNGPEGWDEIPLEIARQLGHDDLVLLLIKGGAQVTPWDLGRIFNFSNQELHEKCLEALHYSANLDGLLISIIMVGAYERYTVLDMVSEFIREELTKTQNSLSKLKSRLNWFKGSNEREVLLEFLDDEDVNGRGLELMLDALAGIHIEQQAREILWTALLDPKDAVDTMLNRTRTSESSALHTLVSWNAPNALSVFLDLAPYLNAIDGEGNTALHVAAARKRLACAQQLLQSGIDLNVENYEGETAAKVALRAGHPEMESLIVSYMAVMDREAA